MPAGGTASASVKKANRLNFRGKRVAFPLFWNPGFSLNCRAEELKNCAVSRRTCFIDISRNRESPGNGGAFSVYDPGQKSGSRFFRSKQFPTKIHTHTGTFDFSPKNGPKRNLTLLGGGNGGKSAFAKSRSVLGSVKGRARFL